MVIKPFSDQRGGYRVSLRMRSALQLRLRSPWKRGLVADAEPSPAKRLRLLNNDHDPISLERIADIDENALEILSDASGHWGCRSESLDGDLMRALQRPGSAKPGGRPGDRSLSVSGKVGPAV